MVLLIGKLLKATVTHRGPSTTSENHSTTMWNCKSENLRVSAEPFEYIVVNCMYTNANEVGNCESFDMHIANSLASWRNVSRPTAGKLHGKSFHWTLEEFGRFASKLTSISCVRHASYRRKWLLLTNFYRRLPSYTFMVSFSVSVANIYNRKFNFFFVVPFHSFAFIGFTQSYSSRSRVIIIIIIAVSCRSQIVVTDWWLDWMSRLRVFYEMNSRTMFRVPMKSSPREIVELYI